MDANFIARMEQILHLYGLPFDALYPVICFDERPCFLIGEAVSGLEMKAGQAARQHYAYKKNGSCALLMAIEPKTGQRLARVFDRRTKREYAQFMKELAESYPQAKKIRIVQDNLNTHSTSSFYETFSAEEAFALSQRFEFYYTPKSASWLNLIEIEFSALSKQCLNRRIATQEILTQEVLAIVKEREEKAIKIDWQFSIDSARTKLNRHYQQVNAENVQYKRT
ncbi:MAG TPA: IS630 family transposase [Pyrinomonadaceae bacterium]|nr:IS630 family transposase [Pyrinomonadaceae bacterium]